jgi:hypothetical protein
MFTFGTANRQVPGSSPGLGSIPEDPGPDFISKEKFSRRGAKYMSR